MDNAYQFFKVNNSTGQLTYFGTTSAASRSFRTGLTITANNMFAYGASSFYLLERGVILNLDSGIYGFQRASDGDLTFLGDAPIPAAKVGGFYLPYFAAADTTNHVAVSLQRVTIYSPYEIYFGLYQLATYTVSSSGVLSTSSTYANMPAVAVDYVNDLKMAPGGKLLAVAGTQGLQVFRFPGSSQITKFTGLLLPTVGIDQIFWDNANHLYAVSVSTGNLFVFTVTTTSVSQAAGSPYSIASPRDIRDITVQPK